MGVGEPTVEGPVAFHEAVALERASRSDDGRNVAVAFEVTGEVDEDALERAVAWLGAHHEGFRTSFHREGGEWRRRVHPAALRLERASVEPGALRDEIGRRARIVRPLGEAPLAGLSWLRTGPGAGAFVCAADHVVIDGIGAVLALRHLGTAYATLREGGVPALPPAPQPRDLVAPSEALLAPLWADRAWAVREHGFRWPPDPGLPGGDDGDTGLALGPIPDRQAQTEAAARRGVSQAAWAVAAMARALREVTGQRAVAFSLARGGREGLARHTVASVVYTDSFLAGDADGDALVAEAEAFVQDRSPWRRVYNATVAPPSRRILLNLLQRPFALDLAGAAARMRPDWLPRPRLSPFHDVVVQPVEIEGTSLAAVAFRTCTYEPATAQRLLDAFAAALREDL